MSLQASMSGIFGRPHANAKAAEPAKDVGIAQQTLAAPAGLALAPFSEFRSQNGTSAALAGLALAASLKRAQPHPSLIGDAS